MPGGGQTRPNLKVQDGCGNRCSFCVIPVTRGHSRSLPMEACLRNVQAFAGRRRYRSWCSPASILGAGEETSSRNAPWKSWLSGILLHTSLPRLRLSSIEPMDWTPQLLALFRDGSGSRLARHAHLPLQSGSDAILRAMHRRYRPWHYAEKLHLIRDIMPDAAIGADVMVGFPGESDALFEESFAFVAAQSFTYLHLFPFSARPGTRAWQLAQEHSWSHTWGGGGAHGTAAHADRGPESCFPGSASSSRELPAVTLHTNTQGEMGHGALDRQFS